MFTLNNLKIRAKLFHFIYTVSKLVIYIFTFRYSLTSRVFPQAKYSVVCTEFPVRSKFHFSQWKIHFSRFFIFIDKYLKFKEIKYFIHYIEFEIWPALFYVNSLYFQQWSSNWDIAFFNSSLDSKLGFLDWVLGCTLTFS